MEVSSIYVGAIAAHHTHTHTQYVFLRYSLLFVAVPYVCPIVSTVGSAIHFALNQMDAYGAFIVFDMHMHHIYNTIHSILNVICINEILTYAKVSRRKLSPCWYSGQVNRMHGKSLFEITYKRETQCDISNTVIVVFISVLFNQAVTDKITNIAK